MPEQQRNAVHISPKVMSEICYARFYQGKGTHSSSVIYSPPFLPPIGRKFRGQQAMPPGLVDDSPTRQHSRRSQDSRGLET